ncbi:uncharacterized protein PITG_07138 [Phytophthora infestans T30-4]|uniref:Uncharacterized protein n=1 Tax=Phytophthora infestans (strain T30-4) TaxID=403677 RepID=D0N7D2_PHYIT|nr:uncharacterized protein PITG_07138 [Phytophthora infestans T30-4]EEY53481.1 conserved hypothetical protein [Phytophthora infestans T30-4]|eukprot:XP_002905099.1 conserved hypothetical protein [Phytophthora infestans T30-4]
MVDQGQPAGPAAQAAAPVVGSNKLPKYDKAGGFDL